MFTITDGIKVYLSKTLPYNNPKHTIDILMIVGQSNALGQYADETHSVKPEKDTVYLGTMGDTRLLDSGTKGWAGALGKTWHDRTGHTVLIVKAAWGGNISEEIADNHLAYVKTKMDEGVLWVTTLDEAAIYSYQRANTIISKVSQTDTELKISISDELDDGIFDADLTVNVTLPNGWTNAVIATADGNLTGTVKDGIFTFNVPHDIGEITVSKYN